VNALKNGHEIRSMRTDRLEVASTHFSQICERA